MKRPVTRAATLALVLAVMGCEGADVTRVIDAETVVVKGHKLKLIGVAGPRRDAECERERFLADSAVAQLADLISEPDVSFRKAGMACLQFMTCEAFVTAGGEDVGKTLVREGLLAPVPGVDDPPIDWCALPAPADAPPVDVEFPPPPEQMIMPAEPGAAEPNAPESLQTTQPN